jgi:gliding motility-associated-like protein
MKCESSFSDPIQAHKHLKDIDLTYSDFYSGQFTETKRNKMKFINWLLLSAFLFTGFSGHAVSTSGYSTADKNMGNSNDDFHVQSPVLPPVAICRNITVNMGPGGTVTINASQVDGGSYDPDGTIANRAVSPDTFSCSQLGPNTVTLTVTDDEGLTSSCTTSVVIADRTSPTALCKNAILYLDLTGKASLDISDIDNGSSDNCSSGFFRYLSRTDFNCSDTGAPVSVTLTATDGSGNSSSCTAQVTVLDTVKPRVFVKPFNLILGPSGTGTLLPANVDNGTFDNCGSVTLSVSPDSFSCSDIGTKTVTLTALDSHGNSASRNVTVTISSDLQIKGMSLSSCDMTPTLALFQSNVEGGNGIYSYFWKGLDETKKPFMVITTWPPSVHFYNTSTLATPYFNNNVPNGLYDIRLVVTDGNGCVDTSEITINKTGPVFNNQTIKRSEACEGEVVTYSVNYFSDATYSWSVVHGTILDTDQDTSRISVRWDLGETEGIVTTTVGKSNPVFPGGDCESMVIDTVALIPVPVPVYDNPVSDVCSGNDYTYTLTASYDLYLWTVSGGVITGGGTDADNYVAVRWGEGSAGTIMVSAGNTLGCSGSATLSVAINNLTGNISSITNVTCNGNSDGAVTAVATTGIAPYRYSLDGGAFQASGSFSSLAPGNHTITINDALLCSVDLPFIITQPSPVYGTISAIADVSCFGGSDGSATITASGGVAPYQYSLNSGSFQGSSIFMNLTAGSYTVMIADINGCTGTTTFNITQPATALAGNVSVTDVGCFGASTGAIALEVTGGVQPYSYLWSNGSVTRDISNLAAGNYSVAITDSWGCVRNINATVSQPSAAVAGTGTITNVTCFGEATGAIDLLASGGVAPYTYLWSNGSATEDLTGIPAGTYSVTITDANGCITSYSGTVTEPAASVGGSVTSQVNVSCRGGNDGMVTVLGSGGIPPYEYNIDGGVSGASGTFTGLSAGNHQVTITDHNLCTHDLTVTVTEPDMPLGGTIMSQNDVSCFGESTGSVTIAGTGGTSPYNFSIDGGSYQAAGLFENLGSGAHAVIIKDFNQCQYVVNVNIDQPASPLSITAVKTDVLCRGGSTGTAQATAAGGTSPYVYSWNTSPVQTGSAATGLSAGIYIVTVTDANGCTASTSVTIDQPATSMTAIAAVTDADCFGTSSGSIDLTVSNGTSPLTYLWSNGSMNEDITDLGAGTYSVLVTDANGCTANASATVGQPDALTGSIIVTNAACMGENSGSANLSVSGGIAPYSFLWSNGETTEDIDTIPAGTYSVTVTDVNSCFIVVNCTVNQPSSVLGGSITAQTNVSEYGINDGSVTVAGTGGSGSYEYCINNSAYQASGTFSSLFAGIYTVTVRDAGLCTFDIGVTITQPSIPLTARILSQTNVLCYDEETGSVTVTGWGGTSPYVYSVDGINFLTSGTFSLLGAGRDTIIVRDALLDEYRLPIEIIQPEPLVLALTKTEVLCRGGATGTASVIVAGGTGPFAYEWNTVPAQTTANATGLRAGTYVVSVTDSNGCNTTAEIIILQPNEDLTITSAREDPRCPGGLDGSAAAIVSGGTGPYTYSWDTSPVQTTSAATSLGAGNYTVTVTDINGCSNSGQVTLSDPEPVTIDYEVTPASCPDSEDGTITLDVSGGTPPYNYNWSDNVITRDRSNIRPATVSVVITDQNFCTASVDIEVGFTGTFECVEIPQIITPNNDGHNDTWILKNIDLYPDAEILIFNRWGKLIFQTKNIADNPWDGRYDGKLVPTDSYHYILYLNDGSGPKTGVISVIR